jgi:hypothetical protein
MFFFFSSPPRYQFDIKPRDILKGLFANKSTENRAIMELKINKSIDW